MSGVAIRPTFFVTALVTMKLSVLILALLELSTSISLPHCTW